MQEIIRRKRIQIVSVMWFSSGCLSSVAFVTIYFSVILRSYLISDLISFSVFSLFGFSSSF